MAKADSIQDRLLAMEEGGLWDAIGQWVQANLVTIGAVIAILILLAGGGFYWRHQRASALEHLRTGILALQSGDAQKALEDFQRISSSSLSNTERALAGLYLGEAYTTLGKADAAVKSYEQALVAVRKSKSGSYLEQLLLVRVAQNAENKGADVDARKAYEQAADSEGPLKAESFAAAARLSEKLNDSAGANVFYKKLTSLDPTYPLAEVFQGKFEK